MRVKHELLWGKGLKSKKWLINDLNIIEITEEMNDQKWD